MSNNKIAVIGAGSWGTALANLLSKNELDTTLWSQFEQQITELKSTGKNQQYLPGINLSKTLNYSADLAYSASNKDAILIATPSFVLREVLKKLKPYIKETTIFILACKGFEQESGFLLHNVFNQELPNNSLAVLSGPTFAKEVAMGQPTAVTIASESKATGTKVVNWFHNSTFRPYYSSDVTGVEFGGAVKNILAIAAGITDGLQLGANSRAALITRGLHELMTLGLALGAKTETLMGLSGLGDLMLTCTDNLSRNRQLGLLLAKGFTQEQAKEKIGQEVEGIRAAKIAKKIVQQNNVDTPIINVIYQVLFENLDPKEAVNRLMNRDVKAE